MSSDILSKQKGNTAHNVYLGSGLHGFLAHETLLDARRADGAGGHVGARPEQRVALVVRTHHALRQAVVVSTHITVCVFLLVGVELVVRYAGRKHIKQLVVWCAEEQAGKVLLHRACAGFLSGSALQQNTFWRLTFKYQSFSPTRF